jgi:hypothetical protein
MPERSSAPSARPARTDLLGEAPPPDVAEFIRFCHRRRHVGWPELYDEMCAVAARREFNGWGAEQLAERGVTFALFEMPRLSAWVRMITASAQPAAEPTAAPIVPQPATG